MEQILKDALFLANVCDTLQISGYIKQELFDEHAALVENINETIARVFKYAAQQSVQPTDGSLCKDCGRMTAQQGTRSQLIELASPMPPFIYELRQKIRAGKKTQTRRPLDPQPSSGVRKSPFVPSGFEDGHGRVLKPKYPDGIRYLREPLIKEPDGFAHYRDDGLIVLDENGNKIPWRWQRPILAQIFMPKNAARFFVKWEVYRLQQIQAISNEDIKAEGIAHTTDYGPLLHSMFKELWDSINADRGFAFGTSPYVWAYDFNKYGQGEI